jgi:hypothetical protein
MKKISITIEGTSPLLMNRYNVEAELEKQKNKRISKEYNPNIEAENSAYWSSGKKKELIIPANVLYRSMLNGASWYKINKRSAKSVLAGSIKIEPEEISLGTSKYIIDTRPVVIQRNRVLKSRARVDKWKADFTLVFDDRRIPESSIDDIKAILEEAGERIGIMDFRPQKSGWYGTFKIVKFEIEK